MELNQKWDGVYNATYHRPACMSFEFLVSKEIFGEEDCLYLDVHTSKVGNTKHNRIIKFPEKIPTLTKSIT